MATNGALNGALTEPFPTAATAPSILDHRGFKITTQKLPILKAGPIDSMTTSLGIVPPEMIFGDNHISISHPRSGWFITFNAFDALDRVDKTGEKRLQVAHSSEWQKSREHHHEGIKEIVKPFDWSYTTDYAGTTSTEPAFQDTVAKIPTQLLQRQDPIKFFDEVMLYEDELADNGITMLSCKIRVMPDRLLLLCRFFMRLDNVLVRIRDTRVFVEFGTGEVIREYTAREEKYEVVRGKLASSRADVAAVMRDANALSSMIPVVEKKTEMVCLG